ncbi:hypothetical protein [Streptomyces sp. NRRL S-1868]|uniref:hypothetical protein n=1 Tax=Streptomyces sp. NRRL S-1868 TaxID=1463892 RepID=UPI0004BD87FB|nr:hypothetical protein [Streptomyces sp. NRRL S-1868]
MTAKRITDAEGALDALREALVGAGISLPSLRLHPGTWGDHTGVALIDLGPCNLETARKLGNILRKGYGASRQTERSR